MPQDTKAHGFERPLWEGRRFHFKNQTGLFEIIEAAFDYRGDVTLELKDGCRLEGYVFNRVAEGAEPHLQLFPKGASGTRTIPYADIVAIEFTGEDTAFGKSWEAWVAKSETLRRAEEEKIRRQAESRGEL